MIHLMGFVISWLGAAVIFVGAAIENMCVLIDGISFVGVGTGLLIWHFYREERE